MWYSIGTTMGKWDDSDDDEVLTKCVTLFLNNSQRVVGDSNQVAVKTMTGIQWCKYRYNGSLCRNSQSKI